MNGGLDRASAKLPVMPQYKWRGSKRGAPEAILTEVMDAVKEWPRYANTAGVPGSQRDKITRTLKLKFDRRGILT